MSMKTTGQTPTVLRIREAALAIAPPHSGVGSSGCSAWLSGPAGSGTARILHLESDAVHHDMIVVDYEGGNGPHSRTWVLHSVVGELAVYTLLAESPTAFPGRSHALAG